MNIAKCRLKLQDRFKLSLTRILKDRQKAKLISKVKKLESTGATIASLEEKIKNSESKERVLMDLEWTLQLKYIEEMHKKSKGKENDILSKHNDNQELVRNATGVRGEVDCLTKNLKKFY